MKRYIYILPFIVSFFVHPLNGYSQQEVQISQYMITPMLSNPSLSSVDDYWETNISYRNQWIGIPDGPKTTYLSSQKPLGKPHFGRTHKGDFHNWHGVGAVIMKDQIGPYSNTKVQANYSYNIALTAGQKYGAQHKDGLRLALGVTAGYVFYTIDKEILGMKQLSTTENVTNNRAISDATYAAIAENGSISALDMNFGATLYFRETFFLGISSSQILQNEVNLGAKSSLWRHYFITGKYKWQVNEQWYVIPSMLLKYVSGAPVSYDFSLQADWTDKVFFGMGYRHRDAVSVMTGLRFKWGEKIKNFRKDKHRYIVQVFYSYDITTSKLGQNDSVHNSKGAHEITIGFLLPPMFRERNAEDTWKGKNTNNMH